MRTKAEVVVVGGGIMGLSIAYNLARYHKIRDVVVVEQGYLCGGASGRNGGGVRAQWSSGVNVRLMRESIRICEDFAREMKINIWFRQGGYLFLARSDERRKALESSVAIQREEGLKTQLLTPNEAKRLVPELELSGVVAASYNATDGVVFPWPLVWGYAEGARRYGVEIQTHTTVTGFQVQGAKIQAVETNCGVIETHTVVNAAGAWSPQVAALLGVKLPNHPHRHEICSTEPLKPWLQPLVADLENGLYFSQSMRGEIVGGISNQDVPPGLNMDSSSEFLRCYADALTSLVPKLGSVKVLRQWAGCYDLTPDANPIVGEVDEVQRFFQASGFMGHGFMMAPVMGRKIAAQIAEGGEDELFSRWSLRRFKEGRLLSEAMIIG